MKQDAGSGALDALGGRTYWKPGNGLVSTAANNGLSSRFARMGDHVPSRGVTGFTIGPGRRGVHEHERHE